MAYHHPPTRRLLLRVAWPLLALGSGWLPASPARAQAGRVPISDMHSHYGLISRRAGEIGMAEELRAQRIALVAWSMPSDLRWTRLNENGVIQSGEPAPGELLAFFRSRIELMAAYAKRTGLRIVLTPGDVDACLAAGGPPGVVLASEGSDFLEGQLDNLAGMHTRGLRHLQLVHYIRNPVGDFQTVAPTHGGLSALGKQLVQACNARGILVDLAHCTGQGVEQALEVASKPVVWSHSWVDNAGGQWQDVVGFRQRRLSLALAKRIADRGGVVGLWGFGLANPGPDLGDGSWAVARGDTRGYARELAKLVDKLGADHVALGTDVEGVGPNWSVNNYAHVREVVDRLQDKLPASTLDKVAGGNYARVLKQALAV